MHIIRVFIFIFAAIGAVLPTFPVLAQEAYTVENVKINIEGANPVEARQQALSQAQEKAFGALLKTLNNGDVLPFDMMRVAPLVEDFELVEEKISPDHYAAIYTFRFNRMNVQEMVRNIQYTQGQGAPASPYQAQSTRYSDLFNDPVFMQDQVSSHVMPATAPHYPDTAQTPFYMPPQDNTHPPLILPYWRVGERVTLWGADNRWYASWQALEETAMGQQRFTLPLGDLSDMRATGESLSHRPDYIQQLKARYQTPVMIVAIAEPQSSMVKISLYTADQNGLSFWQEIQSPVVGFNDPYRNAVLDVSNALLTLPGISPVYTDIQPAQRVAPMAQSDQNAFYIPPQISGHVQTIRVQSSFVSPKEWLQLRAGLQAEENIRAVRILSLKPRGAVIELDIIGAIEDLQYSLSRRNIALQPGVGGMAQGYVVQFSGD